MSEIVEELKDRTERLERMFQEAFPNGDHVGHSRYHQLMIDQLEERRRLRIAVQEKTIAGLVWAAIVGIGAAVWNYLATHLTKGG